MPRSGYLYELASEHVKLWTLKRALESAREEYARRPSRECQAEIMRLETLVTSHPAQSRLGNPL